MTRESDEKSVPIAQESLRVDKRQVHERVRIRTVTDEVRDVARATLDEVAVTVERVPVGREVERAPEVRTEGDLTIVPVLEEVLVVEKRLVLKEELHIRRAKRTEDVEVPTTLRKQRVEIERVPETKDASSKQM